MEDEYFVSGLKEALSKEFGFDIYSSRVLRQLMSDLRLAVEEGKLARQASIPDVLFFLSKNPEMTF